MARAVRERVGEYLRDLLRGVEASGNKRDLAVAQRLDKVVRQRWDHLFTCYEVDFLPRTNNEMEQMIGEMKSRYRQTTGRKSVSEALLRYGCYIACVDRNETYEQLLVRLQQVSHEEFEQERQRLEKVLERFRKEYRFRKGRDSYLRELENRWAELFSPR